MLIVALHDKNFFNPSNPIRISTIPYLLTFNTQESINLNSITNFSKTITLTNVHDFNCLNLKELNSIQQSSNSATPIVFNVPNLTNAKSIWLSNIENINLPNLKECARLTFGNEDPITKNTPTLPDITLEKLEKVNEKFSILNPQKLNLPSIKYINNFKIESNNNLNNFNFIAPNLERIDNLEIRLSNCKDVTQIVKKLSSIIKLAKKLTLNINDNNYSKEEIDIKLLTLKECALLTFGNENLEIWNTSTLPNITLEKLEKVNKKFSVSNPQKLNLPSIKYINNFKIESNNNLNNFNFIAPNLERIDNLEIRLSNCKDVTQIVKKLSSIIKLAKNLTLNINDNNYSKEEIDKLLKET